MANLIDKMKEIKTKANPDNLGMILVHNGVVRSTSKTGKKVSSINISYDEEKLEKAIKQVKSADAVEDVFVKINSGKLKVGDDVMYIIIAGNRRKNLLPIFSDFIETIKNLVEGYEDFVNP